MLFRYLSPQCEIHMPLLSTRPKNLIFAQLAICPQKPIGNLVLLFSVYIQEGFTLALSFFLYVLIDTSALSLTSSPRKEFS